MKRGELLLLFFTITISVVIIITALFYFIKPTSNIKLQNFEHNRVIKDIDVEKKSWIEKISKQNKTFSYPVVIYRLD